MPLTDWAQFSFSVIFVFFLLAACLWWLAKRKGGLLVNRVNKPIQVVDTLQLGIKHKLMLVRVEEQKILVSITPNEMHALHTWRDQTKSTDTSTASGTLTRESLRDEAQHAKTGAQSFKDTLGDVHGVS